jgi:PTS system mannose-specific IID component
MTPALRWGLFWRALFIQACWNYEGMQNVGFAFAIFPALRAAYDGEELGASCARHLEFFNTQPFMASFALGLTARMESERSAAPQPQREVMATRIASIKKAMASPLAAIGDRLFWGTLRPFTLVLTLCMCWALGMRHWVAGRVDAELAAQFNFTQTRMIVALLFGMLVYNAAALWIRWAGLGHGYNCGASGACGLDFVNWQGVIKRLKVAGFVTTVFLFVLKLWSFVQVELSAPVRRQDIILYCLFPAVIAATVLLLQRGWHIVRIYIAAVLVSAVARLIA